MCIHSALPATWTTISPGYWNNPAVWSTGIVPPYASADTFIIHHPVAFEDNIILNAGAFMQIDSTGGLCAHNNITVNTGAAILKFGILEADSMDIPGGTVNCIMPGELILWKYETISNGGSFYSDCTFNVGRWFECLRPWFGYMSVSEYESENNISIFPNPANDDLTIETPRNSLLEISNIESQLIKTFAVSSIKTNIDISALPCGVYIVKVKTEKGVVVKKFVKE